MSSKGYRQTTLGAIANFMNGGAWNQTEYSDEGVPVVRVTDIKGETVDLSECKFLPKASLAKYRRYLLETGDLVICTVGSHPTQPGSVVGRAAVIPPSAHGTLLNQNAVRIRSALRDIDQGWLSYLGRSKPFHDYIISCARGSANQVRMAIGLLKEMPVEVPPLSIQQRIAGILSAYDKLIENSRRRIKVLESMARALYREWLIHFRFPGYENHPRVDSPLGDIPEGWEVRRLDEALKFESGKTIKKEERESGDTPVYGANGIIGGTANPPMAQRCIIMGKIGSCGALHRSHVPCWITNNAFLVRPAAIHSYELTWQLLLDIDFKQYIGGAANPYMPINSFGQHEVLVAPTSLQEDFKTKTDALRCLAETLSDSIRNLRRTRDLLLPRLLEGNVDLNSREP